jgi:hypothetical protein
MTEHRAPSCHYDRQMKARVTREHRDDCPDPATHSGCKPCTAPHCAVCGREHTSNDQPVTCPTCEGKIRADLTAIPAALTELALEALAGGNDGRLVAAAPIPGGTAQVLIGPSVRMDLLRTGSVAGMKTLADDHRRHDPIPPLAVLGQWDSIWRGYLGHTHPPGVRPTAASCCAYLTTQLGYMAQQTGPGVPDFSVFAHQVRSIRSRLEHALHDEREPERGVECFECGDQLVRRFRDHRHCRHSTPAREELRGWLIRQADGQAWLRTLATYPEAGGPRWDEVKAAAGPPAELLAAARLPCPVCAAAPGGIDNPDPGQSWECPGCRREYSVGEYANAVRRDLLQNGVEGDGWTHVGMAAEAATTMTGYMIPAGTVRKWVDRGKVSSRLTATGVRLVFWADVADEAAAAVRRAVTAAADRRRRVELEEQLWTAVAAGMKPRDAGRRLGISRARVVALCEQWSEEGRLDYSRAPDLGWAVAG